jgi:hypothetical protein
MQLVVVLARVHRSRRARGHLFAEKPARQIGLARGYLVLRALPARLLADDVRREVSKVREMTTRRSRPYRVTVYHCCNFTFGAQLPFFGPHMRRKTEDGRKTGAMSAALSCRMFSMYQSFSQHHFTATWPGLSRGVHARRECKSAARESSKSRGCMRPYPAQRTFTQPAASTPQHQCHQGRLCQCDQQRCPCRHSK